MIPPTLGIGSLGASEWSVGGVGGLGSAASTSATGATGSGSFGDALSSAISGLENTQADATQAAQGLATGTISDPTQAITAVENASLAMDFASQIRNQIDTAATTLFQTQM